MLVKVSHHLRLGREVMGERSLGDARFQSTLYSIASQVVSSLVAFTIQKRFRFFDSNFGQLVEVGTIHFIEP